MSDGNAAHLAERAGKLFGKKSLFDALCQEIAYNFYVERADFTVERIAGEDLAAHLFDSAPLLNRRDLGNAFSSMLRPRGQPWFRAVVDEELMENPAVGAYCDFYTETMRTAMYARKSGFVRATKAGDHDYAAFGNTILTVEAAVSKIGQRHALYRCWHLRDCAWVEDVDGSIDTMFRKFKASARQVEQKFPEVPLPQAISEACTNSPDQEFELMHVMMPADDYEYYDKPRLRMPYASIYIDMASKTLLRERPSKNFRYVTPRWQLMSNSQYAYSPAAICSLSDSRGLQVMARVLLEAGEKQVDPPMKATQKAIKSEVNLYAGGITWVDRDYDERLGPSIEPINLAENTGLGIELLDRTTAKLKDAWYLSKLSLPPPSADPMTATEASLRVEEFIRANIPLFEPLETEYNEPLLEETAAVLTEIGAFGPPNIIPKELRNGDLEWKFSNDLQNAIEKNKVNQYTTLLGLAAGTSKIDPKALQRIDWQEGLVDAVRGSGAPADWLRDPDQVAAEQQQQDQSGAILNALNTAGQAADVVNQGADAAAKLHDLTGAPADNQVAYGPT